MPVWGSKPGDFLQESLDEVVADLSQQVQASPTFTEVAGIPLETLIVHATRAIATAIPTSTTELNKEELLASVQIYCLGFVVGTKYGQRNANKISPHHPSHEKEDDL